MDFYIVEEVVAVLSALFVKFYVSSFMINNLNLSIVFIH